MTIKELKRLSRAELLQLLLYRTREVEDLQAKVEQLQAQLEDKQLQIREAGSIAEASVRISGILEAAQAAADQYLMNIARLEAQTKEECDRLLEQAREGSQ